MRTETVDRGCDHMDGEGSGPRNDGNTRCSDGAPRPTLRRLREAVGSEEWLAALALLDLSPSFARDAGQFTSWSEFGGRTTETGFEPDPEMDWETWVASVDQQGRGWSSTEWRLFEIVVALVIPERTVALRGVLDLLGSWECEVLDVLVQWASGGNNRDLPGRLRVSSISGTG